MNDYEKMNYDWEVKYRKLRRKIVTVEITTVFSLFTMALICIGTPLFTDYSFSNYHSTLANSEIERVERQIIKESYRAGKAGRKNFITESSLNDGLRIVEVNSAEPGTIEKAGESHE